MVPVPLRGSVNGAGGVSRTLDCTILRARHPQTERRPRGVHGPKEASALIVLGLGRRNPKGSGTGAEHCPGGGGEAARSSAEPLRVCQTGVEKSSERRGQGDSFSANGRM